MSVTLLTHDELDGWLAEHRHWQRHDDGIERTMNCPSFMSAIDTVARIAELADDRDHHPDIDIRYRTLRIALSTHSEGGVTGKDTELAELIDELAPAG
jgi:4a-hydroxytetrahydrobiopterin dehydratase